MFFLSIIVPIWSKIRYNGDDAGENALLRLIHCRALVLIENYIMKTVTFHQICFVQPKCFWQKTLISRLQNGTSETDWSEVTVAMSHLLYCLCQLLLLSSSTSAFYHFASAIKQSNWSPAACMLLISFSIFIIFGLLSSQQ